MSWKLKVNILAEAEVAAALLRAERYIALLTRCRPLNMEAEHQRLLGDWGAGVASEPAFRYAPTEEMSGLRGHLRAIERSLRNNPWRELYAARIAEMTLETKLVEAVGTKDIVALSQERYRAPFAPEPAGQLAAEWGALVVSGPTELVASDDLADGRSLVRRVSAWVGRERLPFRVEVSRELASLAATGEGFVVVAAGRSLSPEDAERVAVHEVLGHARPRVRARKQGLGLFSAASAGGNDIQEGYAVLCEQRAGVLHSGRRFELALRHMACVGLWQGVGFADNVERLKGKGAPLDQALRICLRVYRGGGLGREGTYLPSFCAVSKAVEHTPELSDWLAAGRLGLTAIARLRDAGHELA